MRSKTTKKLLIEALKRNPIVLAACQEVAIALATFYRWKVIDRNFAYEVEQAQALGRSIMSDKAKSGLLSAVEASEPWAIKFMLQNHRNLFMMSLPSQEPDDYPVVTWPRRKKLEKSNVTRGPNIIIKEPIQVQTHETIKVKDVFQHRIHPQNQYFILRMNFTNDQLRWLRAFFPRSNRVVHCTLMEDEARNAS